jgi:hypothetical protein
VDCGAFFSRTSLVGILMCMALLATTVSADEWPLPTTRAYFSPDRAWRFTVTPRPIASQLAYFQDEVANRQQAGAVRGNPQKSARGLLEHLNNQEQWQPVWNQPLLNDVSPVEAIVSPLGRVATFDNWHSKGYGKEVVVIYDDHGKAVRAMGLEDFLPKDYIRALPRSVSSIWWGDHHYFSSDGKHLILRVVVPSVESWEVNSSDRQHVELAFDVATGRSVPSSGKAWPDALKKAMQVRAADRKADAESYARFVAPLLGPYTDSERDWHGYLQEAFFRIDADWQNDYPMTVILRLPQQKDYQASVGFLNDALHDSLNIHGAIMIASPSQDNLVHVLSDAVLTVPQGYLKEARVYVAVDDAHTTAVRKALAATSATYIQLDPSKPIPQRKARLGAYRNGD